MNRLTFDFVIVGGRRVRGPSLMRKYQTVFPWRVFSRKPTQIFELSREFESHLLRHLNLPKSMVGPHGALFSFCFKGV